jgi:hypothetical protein
LGAPAAFYEKDIKELTALLSRGAGLSGRGPQRGSRVGVGEPRPRRP